jgi:hypothetical protein
MLWIKMVLPSEMKIGDRLERTPTKPTDDVVDPIAGLPALQARHGGILGKGRGAVSDSIRR